MSPAIRPARPGDLAAVRALLSAAGLPLLGLEDQFGPAYLVAEADGTILGAIGVETWGRDGLLRSAVVDPAWKGRGVGEALVRAALRDAAARGLEAVYLLTTTAERYFPRFGFARVEREALPESVRRSPEFREACPATAAALALRLAPPPSADR